MIDFHTHVLPGIDDGSRNIGMTEAMLREESAQGTGIVVATPHFYANSMSVQKFLDKRQAAFEETERLRETLPEGSLPQLMTGAEVYYFEGMGDAEMLPRLTIEGTDTILVEMPFAQWTKEVCRDIEHIIRKQRLRVVLAHVERYDEFQKDRSAWDEVFSLPLIPQINTGSFIKKKTGLFRTDKKRKFAMQFLKTHPDMILGSDCHNMEGRRPNLKAGREEIAAAFGDEALERIDRTTREVLGL